ncbi:terpene synthase 10-like [Daucus carota subsp. sativus]|nr:PREDICTED: terpene synthase 10-like [Daucus carota subsp. sativus]
MSTLIADQIFPVTRRSGNYKPCVHRDNNLVQSLNTDFKVERFKERVDELKEEVVGMFADIIKSLDQLELIADLQRLGLANHFDEEIKRTLKKIYENRTSDLWEIKDLHATALMFRLLRQHRFDISEDIFESFMVNGSFKEGLGDDVKGTLSLYEAYYFSSEGDSRMEAAWRFASKTLRERSDDIVDPNLGIKVRHALKSPLDWRMPKLEARWYIDVYGKSSDMNPAILELAKLDFNIVQGVYQEDLKTFSRFWNELGLASRLHFARDRLVESFIWALGMNVNPELRYSRLQLAKQVQMITYIDDIYDVYGTLDEVELFTEAIERWDINSIEELPNYMKVCFLALYNYVNEMVYKIFREQNIDVLPYLKRTWIDLSKAYCEEARWFHNGYKPTLEEYLRNGVKSIAIQICIVQNYVCSMNPVDREALEFLMNMPEVLSSACLLGRIVDDNGTSSHELARGDVPKAVQCYMSDTGCTEEEAHAHMKDLMRNYWRQMNKCRLQDTPVPLQAVDYIFDLLRATHYTYRDGDGYSVQHEGKSKLLLNALIVEPIPM